nr:TIGR02587 family membrane protein [Deltaproteobacteria bacterium]
MERKQQNPKHRRSQSDNGQQANRDRNSSSRYLVGIARAFDGAIIFSLPLLMTMEMWWLGMYTDRLRLSLFLIVFFSFLVLLSYHAGYEETFRWKEDIRDACIAYGISIVASGIILSLFSVLQKSTSLDEAVGILSLQAVPCSIGAMLARTELGVKKAEEKEKRSSTRYLGDIFLMAVGALFLAFNVAPTEEIALISYKMSACQTASLMIVSLILMHAFVYGVNFRGHKNIPEGSTHLRVFFRFTVNGYAVALIISLFMLWVFETTEATGILETIKMTVVLGFPASLGAAVARLIL